jgi:predicted GNAT superfamily acetyltransferase
MCVASEVEIRPLRTHDEYRACVALQKETWGENFSECVPPSILMVSQKIGGVAAGAFDAQGRLLGFVFGMTGVKEGRLVHWSDMLAVRKEARGLGLGRKLKLHQRDVLLPLGVEIIYWTYDPLEARNAHLNLNRLGAEVAEYVEEMYGESDSVLHRGLGTDRFVVEWHIASKRVEQAVSKGLSIEARRLEQAPVVNTVIAEDGSPVPAELDLPEPPAVRVEIPPDIQAVKSESPERACEWRATTRRAFQFYLPRGYKVESLARDRAGRCFYFLTRLT